MVAGMPVITPLGSELEIARLSPSTGAASLIVTVALAWPVPLWIVEGESVRPVTFGPGTIVSGACCWEETPLIVVVAVMVTGTLGPSGMTVEAAWTAVDTPPAGTVAVADRPPGATVTPGSLWKAATPAP